MVVEGLVIFEIFPTTSRACAGEVVPIPTLPFCKILTLSFPPLTASKICKRLSEAVVKDQVLVPILYVPAHIEFHLVVEAPML